jgi:hypothetical protein
LPLIWFLLSPLKTLQMDEKLGGTTGLPAGHEEIASSRRKSRLSFDFKATRKASKNLGRLRAGDAQNGG